MRFPALVLHLILTVAVFGQSGTGSLAGIVLNPLGAPFSGRSGSGESRLRRRGP